MNISIEMLGLTSENCYNEVYFIQGCLYVKGVKSDVLCNAIQNVVAKSDVFSYGLNTSDSTNIVIQKHDNQRILTQVKQVSCENEEEYNEIIKQRPSKEDGMLSMFTVVEKTYDPGNLTIVCIMHHAINDGIGLYNVANLIYLETENGGVYEKTSFQVEISEAAQQRVNTYWEAYQEKHAIVPTMSITEPAHVESRKLQQTVVGKLDEIARTYKINKQVLYMLPYILTLYACTGERDVNIDYFTNLRNRKQMKQLGMFANHLPIIHELFTDETIQNMIHVLSLEILSAIKNSNYQLVETGMLFAPYMFSFLPTYLFMDQNSWDNWECDWIQTDQTCYKVSMTVVERKDKTIIKWIGKKTFMSDAEFIRFMNVYEMYAESIVNHFEAYTQLTMDEVYVQALPQTEFSYMDGITVKCDETLEERLDTVFSENQQQVAIIYEDMEFTYSEWYRQIAACRDEIQTYGKREYIIIYGNGSIATITYVFAALSLGIPYFIANDNTPKQFIADIAKTYYAPIFNTMDMPQPTQISEEGHPFLFANAQSEATNILAVFSTSGTTGQPKLIPVKKTSIMNLIINNDVMYKHKNRVALLTDMTFDPSIGAIFGALLHGGTLVTIDRSKLLDHAYMKQQLQTHQVNTVSITPTLFSAHDWSVWENLTHIGLGGEPINEKYLQSLPIGQTNIWNLYGPTEATVYILANNYTQTKIQAIGQPIVNTKIAILNASGQCVPKGMKGELFVCGPGVFDGYINNPTYPFKQHLGDTYYQTADICIMQEENVYFASRKDTQVKINGLRIEMQAIESQLLRYIHSPFVLCVHNNMLTVIHEGTIDEEMVIDQLSRVLPKYMIPKRYVQFAHLPMNKNNKIDMTDIQNSLDDVHYAIPTHLNETEQVVYDVVAKKLGFSGFAEDETLFELGGNSITALQISNELNTRFENITFEDVIRHQTVAKIATCIENSIKQTVEFDFNTDFPLEYEASSMQQMMILHQLRMTNDNRYVMGKLLTFTHTQEKQTFIHDFEQCLEQFAHFHYHVKFQGGKFILAYDENFTVERCTQVSEAELQLFPIDVFKGHSLVRLTEFTDTNSLLVEIHHILADGFTIECILDVMKTKNTITYFPFSEMIRYQNIMVENALNNGEYYDWIRNVANQLKPDQVNDTQMETTSVVSLSLSKKLSEQLKQFVKKYKTTTQMVFIALIHEILYKEHTICFGLPINIRDQQQLMRVMGPGINTLPIVLTENSNIPSKIESIRQQFSTALKFKHVPFSEHETHVESPLAIHTVVSVYEALFDEISRPLAYNEKFNTTIQVYEKQETMELFISTRTLTEQVVQTLPNEIEQVIQELMIYEQYNNESF